MTKALILLVLFTVVGCLPQPTQDYSGQSNIVNSDEEVVQIYVDEPDPTDTNLPTSTSLPVDIIVSQSSVKMELASIKLIPVKIKARNNFQNSSVEVYVDYGDLLGFTINAGDYISTTLNTERIFLSAGQEIDLMLTIDVQSMAPSFKSSLQGGDGKIIIRAVAQQGASELQAEKVVALEVEPKLTVGILTSSVPHTYDQANQIYTRPHTEGIQIVFVNKVQGFGDDGQGPCIHTSSPLRHCNVNNGRMKPGDTYLPPKVMPSTTKQKAVFYNHFIGGDSIGRYIHFNIAPGTEAQ
jgi:hypothetical protein